MTDEENNDLPPTETVAKMCESRSWDDDLADSDRQLLELAGKIIRSSDRLLNGMVEEITAREKVAKKFMRRARRDKTRALKCLHRMEQCEAKNARLEAQLKRKER